MKRPECPTAVPSCRADSFGAFAILGASQDTHGAILLARAARHEHDEVSLMGGFDRLMSEISLYLDFVAIARVAA